MNLSTKTRMMMLTMGVLLVCLRGVPSALAEEPVRQKKVYFSDLNLDSAAGVQTLYTRIHAAAKQVCSQTDPVQRLAVGSCLAQAEQDAVAKVNVPQLTAFYQQKTNVTTPHQKLVASR